MQSRTLTYGTLLSAGAVALRDALGQGRHAASGVRLSEKNVRIRSTFVPLAILASVFGVPACTAISHGEPTPEQSRQALDPSDISPSTTYTVRLLVHPPKQAQIVDSVTGIQGQYVSGVGNNGVLGPAQSSPVGTNQIAYNFTPNAWTNSAQAYTSMWNAAAVLGVAKNTQQGTTGFATNTCVLGDVSTISPTATSSPCSTGQDLIETFEVGETDSVGFMIQLDNIARGKAAAIAFAQSQTLSDWANGVSATGNVFQATDSVAQGLSGLAEAGEAMEAAGVAGAAASGPSPGAVVGAVLAAAGACMTLIAGLEGGDSSQPPAVSPTDQCIGGMLGSPPPGGTTPQDVLVSGVQHSGNQVIPNLTARQLYEGTQDGPLVVLYNAKTEYPRQVMSGSASTAAHCGAALEVALVIDRQNRTTTPGSWGDGLAFQPRSSDSAAVRRDYDPSFAAAVNEQKMAPGLGDVIVDSFRVDPTNGDIEHSEYSYPYIEGCNGQQCTPTVSIEDAVSRAVVSGAAPALKNANTRVHAISPDNGHVGVFYVDDTGQLYSSFGTFDDFDSANWLTYAANYGSPLSYGPSTLTPNGPLAVLKAARDGSSFAVYGVGQNGKLQGSIVPWNNNLTYTSVVQSAPSTFSGAAVAGIATTPAVGDVFYVAPSSQNASLYSIWDVQLPLGPAAQGTFSYTVRELTPIGIAGSVAKGTGLTVVAPSVNDIDVFFYNTKNQVQRAYFSGSASSNGDRIWNLDPSFVANGSPGQLQLSAVSRTPVNIDVAYQSAGNLISIASATYPAQTGFFYTGVAAASSPPALTSLSRKATLSTTYSASSPFSLVASWSNALDLVISNVSRAWGIGRLRRSENATVDYAWQAGSGWSSGSSATTDPVQPHATSDVATNSSGLAAVIEVAPDGTVWSSTATPGAAWTRAEVDATASAVGRPSVVVRDSGEIDIAVRNSSGGILYYSGTATNWPPPTFVGAGYSDPSLVVRTANPAGEIDVAVQGANNALSYYFSRDGGDTWAGGVVTGRNPASGTYHLFPGVLDSPRMVVRPNGEANIVVEGMDHSLHIFKAAPGATWGWSRIAPPNAAYSSPSLVVRSANPADEFDIAVQGPVHTLSYLWSRDGWSFNPYTIPNATAFGDPAIVVRSTGEADVATLDASMSIAVWAAFPGGQFASATVPGGTQARTPPALFVRPGNPLDEADMVFQGSSATGAIVYDFNRSSANPWAGPFSP